MSEEVKHDPECPGKEMSFGSWLCRQGFHASPIRTPEYHAAGAVWVCERGCGHTEQFQEPYE